jgi:transposase
LSSGLLDDIETVHLDRGYDADTVRQMMAGYRITDVVIARRRRTGSAKAKRQVPLGLRWPVERTNAWLANFGQLRRNTDRKVAHRLAQFALAVVFVITAKLIDWRDRWSPGCVPIR